MEFLSSDNAYVKTTTSTSQQSPQSLYTEWCLDEGLLATGSVVGALDSDDNAWMFRHTAGKNNFPSATSDRMVFSSEGQIELFKSTPSPSGSRQQYSVAGISRAYTTNADVNRVVFSFHPDTDSGSMNIKTAMNDGCFLIGGTIQRNAAAGMDFAMKFTYNEGFVFAFKSIKSIYNDTIPILIYELGADNATITNRHTIATVSAKDPETLIVIGDYSYGTISGTVIDESGSPAARKVRCYHRDTGALLTEAISDDEGFYNLKALSDGEMYLVALDDDLPPSLNALILDRVKIG